MNSLWIYIYIILISMDQAVGSWGTATDTVLANEGPGATSTASRAAAQPEWLDCVQASEKCNQNPQCSSRYRVMRQCLVGKEKVSMLDTNRECQAALEVLLESPLSECRCKRGMKNELQCVQSYWSIHMGLTEGGEFYETSPYEPVAPVRHPDAFRLASIISVAPKGFQCPDTDKNCNRCLDAAKACNLNSTCKKQRSVYIATCNKKDPNKGEACVRKRCHKALRQFLDRVPTEYSYRLLFCPCQHEGCSERRRQTIVPDCSFKDKVKPNCLELRRVCRQDPLCRSRLADFHMNCLVSQPTVNSCPNEDNYQACLASYVGLIGTDMTPNYIDSSYSNWTISPWCTCKGSGNHEDECVNFLRDFTDNTCMRNAIQAFGYGIDNMQTKDESTAAPYFPTAKFGSDGSMSTSEPPCSDNDIQLTDNAQCKGDGPKCNLSICGDEPVAPISSYDGQSDLQPEGSSACRPATIWALTLTLTMTLALTLALTQLAL